MKEQTPWANKMTNTICKKEQTPCKENKHNGQVKEKKYIQVKNKHIGQIEEHTPYACKEHKHHVNKQTPNTSKRTNTCKLIKNQHMQINKQTAYVNKRTKILYVNKRINTICK